jgi:hypothetical protein
LPHLAASIKAGGVREPYIEEDKMRWVVSGIGDAF